MIFGDCFYGNLVLPEALLVREDSGGYLSMNAYKNCSLLFFWTAEIAVCVLVETSVAAYTLRATWQAPDVSSFQCTELAKG